MKNFEVAVIPGDGIGPEVCAAALKVLKPALSNSVNFDFVFYPGGADCYLEQGAALPQQTKDGCLKADAVLHGAVGGPDLVFADGTEIAQDFSMKARSLMDLYANVRPIRSLDGVDSILVSDKPIDYVIVRENTEGLYAARGGGNIIRDQVATDTLVMTRVGVERVVRYAADLAMTRNGAPADGKRRVTIVDKANVLRSYAFFRKIALEVLAEYPEVSVEVGMVDAMAAQLVEKPEMFDVIVTENIFGDILSDLGAATVGGLGLAPSAELGASHGYFQGIHGSAPDIAGKGIANPIATILSTSMMLEWLGQRHGQSDLTAAGKRILRAVSDVVRDKECLTRDLGGSSTTTECANAIIGRLSI